MNAVRPLIEVLREVPDPRSAQGRRHPLDAMLALACAAMLCGYRSYRAIAEWGRSYDPALVRALGFTREPTACAATFYLAFRGLDRSRLEALLGAWAEQVLAATADTANPTAAVGSADAVAVDGKTLRGSRKQGAPGVHLLSALSHRLGLTLGQAGVDDKTGEIPVAPALLAGLVVEGRVVTMDALLTQRVVAQTVLAGGGDYVMVVKGNHRQLEADIAAEFGSLPPPVIRPGPRRPPAITATAATNRAS